MGMAMKNVYLLILAGAGLVGGCASDQAHRYYDTARYPPKVVQDVELLSEPPSRAHLVIADFQSRGESPDDMRKRAAAIGADAVIVSLLGGYVLVSSEWMQKESKTNYSRITGTAIIYRK